MMPLKIKFLIIFLFNPSHSFYYSDERSGQLNPDFKQ